MSETFSDPLESVIRAAGEGWLIDSFAPPEDALKHIRMIIESVSDCARQRLGHADVSEALLISEFRRNPFRVRAFFQALGGTRTPDMLLMVWRIMQGMEIAKVTMELIRRKAFRLWVTLQSPNDDCAVEDYKSTKISDFTLLRHFGIVEIDGRPALDGFYPLRLGGRAAPLFDLDDRITVSDVKKAMSRIPEVDQGKIESDAIDAHFWLLRNGVSTLHRLEDLVNANDIHRELARIYVQELKRPSASPLDPVAVATWGAGILFHGLRKEVISEVVRQIKQSPEWKEKNGQ